MTQKKIKHKIKTEEKQQHINHKKLLQQPFQPCLKKQNKNKKTRRKLFRGAHPECVSS